MKSDICIDKAKCTGCAACYSICPKHCIQMKPDKEGFLYPVINYEECIHCNVCVRSCPINFPPEKQTGVLQGFVARHNSESVVVQSTSGGSFTAFAEYVFSKNGVVFGAGFDSQMYVRHFGIQKEDRKRIGEMVCSKYVQSDIQEVFKEIGEYLQVGKLVCFSGTPCQVAGLKSYIKRDYDNLITIDLVCRGVASPAFFAKYLEWQEEREKSSAVYVKFRNKTRGYHSGTMMIEYRNGKRYYGSRSIDYMQKAYFAGACSRYSCYNCQFRSESRCSDFTIFDSWHAKQLAPEARDDDIGYTNIFVNSDKGINILPELKKYMWMQQADSSEMKRLDGIMIDNDPPKHLLREKIISDVLESNSFQKVVQNYFPVGYVDRITEKAKDLFYKIGILYYLIKLRNKAK